MEAEKTEPTTVSTNFDVWKETLTPEFIASHQFIVLSCGACPAFGKTCNKYDTTCRGNFLNWARGRFVDEEVSEECKKGVQDEDKAVGI